MIKYPPLNLPTAPLSLRDQKNTIEVWDTIRKKWVKLTPEEWVRQHVVHFLITHRNYPEGLTSVEGSIRLNQLERRYDILIRNASGTPHLMVECKAPEVKLTEHTFRQIMNYNRVVQVKNIFITNGLTHFYGLFNANTNRWTLLKDVPEFSE